MTVVYEASNGIRKNIFSNELFDLVLQYKLNKAYSHSPSDKNKSLIMCLKTLFIFSFLFLAAGCQ